MEADAPDQTVVRAKLRATQRTRPGLTRRKHFSERLPPLFPDRDRGSFGGVRRFDAGRASRALPHGATSIQRKPRGRADAAIATAAASTQTPTIMGFNKNRRDRLSVIGSTTSAASNH